MPYLEKKTISQYISTGCKRQLRLNLSPDRTPYLQSERIPQGMPPAQPPRPGLGQLAEAGDEWQAAKLDDLARTFGNASIIGNATIHQSGQIRYQNISLLSALSTAGIGQFIVEAEYSVTAPFENALGIQQYLSQYQLGYATLRPDIIEVLPCGYFDRKVEPDGSLSAVPTSDSRLQLRIIDIKLTANPSPSYFAQVVYYSMVLSGWLLHNHLDQQYVVVPNGALWPGKHDASNLAQVHRDLTNQGLTPSVQQLRDAMEEDLETVPFEVLAIRLKRFFQSELPEVMRQPWQALEWHVDNRCSGCDYLGYPWLNASGQSTADPNHCIPTAISIDHLSRIAFIPRGARNALQSQGVVDVSNLATRSSGDQAFDVHQTLRAQRTVISSRAQSLNSQQTQLASNSGTSAIMPRWADLHLYLTVDFDIGSAITFALGLQAFWLQPVPFGNPNNIQRNRRPWSAIVRAVDRRSIQDEQREVLNLLRDIDQILTWCRSQDPQTTVQFYLWDSVQFEHLQRVIGRHLEAILADHTVAYLAWLFPPEDVVPNSALSTRRSPITLLQTVVRAVVACPIPHCYTMLSVARLYHDQSLPQHIARFSVHPLFEDMFSSQIPSERAHEIWTQSATPPYAQQQARLVETVQKRLTALETITKKLEGDLGTLLGQTAPKINIAPPTRQNSLSVDGQLWYAFAKLDSAVTELDVSNIRAMPPHEREARFQSARLSHRLTGQSERDALVRLGLPALPGRRVYAIRQTSREVKVRDGDFNFAIAPENDQGFLDRNFEWFVRGTPLEGTGNPRLLLADVLGVTVVAVDRDNAVLVIDPNTRWPTVFNDLELHTSVDLSSDVILDPIHHDFFTSKLLDTLQAIGNPQEAVSLPLIQRATGQLTGRGSRRSPSTPVSELLWNATAVQSMPTHRVLGPIEFALRQRFLGQNRPDLNMSQWDAWRGALHNRLQIIWGPPGTGKSQTARAVVIGAAMDAVQQNRSIRILICASTYNALDNVLLQALPEVQAMLPSGTFEVYRLRSYLQPTNPNIPAQIDVPLNRHNPSPTVLNVVNRLHAQTGITLVGAPPEQVHNLMQVSNVAQEELFDFILIDEASQMDVAHAILALSALSNGGSVVLAGDPLQLPPIHKAEPPIGLEAMVGSIYGFFKDHHHIQEAALDVNYRSNSSIVGFAVHAGYRGALSSHSPDLRLNFASPLPIVQPLDWPTELYWTDEWSNILDPNIPSVCFTYPDGRSSQWNRFEADAICSMVALLHGRLNNQLLNEINPATGGYYDASSNICTPLEFWQKAVGIVTPHRAQQGLIVSQLQRMFGNQGLPPNTIRDAVDTVERFQGQQRDVIIASFALGDADEIAQEDEFLMSLNRFNVMASRARAKIIVLVSQEVVDHLSGDPETLKDSRLLKVYADSYCRQTRQINLGWIEDSVVRVVPGVFRHA